MIHFSPFFCALLRFFSVDISLILWILDLLLLCLLYEEVLLLLSFFMLMMYSFFVREHIRILKLFQNILPTMVLFLDRRLTGISPIYFLDPLLFLLNATLFFSWLKCIGAAHHLLIWVCLYLRGHPRDPFSNPLQIRLRENSLLGRVLTLFMAS